MAIPASPRHRAELMELTADEMREVIQDLAMAAVPVQMDRALDTIAEVRSRKENGW